MVCVYIGLGIVGGKTLVGKLWLIVQCGIGSCSRKIPKIEKIEGNGAPWGFNDWDFG